MSDPEPTGALLEVRDLHLYFGGSHVLRGLNMTAMDRRVTAVLGRNGVGKTTLVRSIMGLNTPRRGTILFDGEDLTRTRSWARARRGIALVPQGRHIFPNLTVKENIEIGGRRRVDSPFSMERLLHLFPNLEWRLNIFAGRLSGGEQQMLAIARALQLAPRLLLLDEPSEGLAPLMVEQLGQLIRQLSQENLSIVLVEQNLPMALNAADEVRVMERGAVAYVGTAAALRDDGQAQHAYLGV